MKIKKNSIWTPSLCLLLQRPLGILNLCPLLCRVAILKEILATQINSYAIWRSKMKLMRVGQKQIFSIIVNGTNTVRIELLKL